MENNKPSFGQARPTNRNWIALMTEMTTWRKDNAGIPWLKCKEYINSVNSSWGQYPRAKFQYRYTKAKGEIDEMLKYLLPAEGKSKESFLILTYLKS